MTTFSILAVLCGIVYALYTGLRLTPIFSDRGNRTPYAKGGFLKNKVFWQQYQGDGLRSRVEDYEILGATTEDFAVFDLDIKNGSTNEIMTIPVGKTQSDFYLMTAKLPFDPTKEPIMSAEYDVFGRIRSIETAHHTYLAAGRMAFDNDLRFEPAEK